MRYTPNNVARRASAYDVDTCEQLAFVMEIDTSQGTVVCASQPMRPGADKGTIETETLRFRSIYPIKGDSPVPVLFHCYGRQA